MSEKQIKKLYSYTKKMVPPSWRPLLVANVESLEYIGRENLLAMLEDWKMTKQGSEAMIAAIRRTEGKTEYAARQICYHAEMIKNADIAIPTLMSLIPSVKSKPIFCIRRPVGYFQPGNRVFVCMDDEDGDSVQDFQPGEVVDDVCGEIGVQLDADKKGEYSYIYARNPYILNEKDAEFLSSDSDYLLLYSRMSDFECRGEIEMYEDLVLECGNKYFPHSTIKISNNSPEIYFPCMD